MTEIAQTKLCIACQAEIPLKATICSHCSTKQDRRLNFLQNIGAVIGVLTAILAFGSYIISSAPSVRKTLWWRDDINMLSYSDEHVVIGNNGDGPVFVSYIYIHTETQKFFSGESTNMLINKMIEPGQILTFDKTNKFLRGGKKWRVVSNVTDAEWEKYLQLYNDEPSDAGECTLLEYVSTSDPDMQLFTRALGDGLRKVNATATIYFFSNKLEKELSKSFPVFGILYKFDVSCSDLYNPK